MKILSTLVALLFAVYSFAGVGYSGPESVAYHAASNTYFVSNTSGYITKQVMGNALQMFTNAPTSPYGIVVVGDVLYACDNGRVKGYDVNNGTEVFNVNLNGGFLNGITSDGNDNLFVTDFSDKKIFRVKISSGTFSTLVNNTVSTPNGIAYDGANNRLVFVNWGANAAIKGVSLSDSTVSTLKSTTLGNCDGIDRDCMGNWYVSSWSPSSKITRFTPDFGIEQNISVTGGLASPADLYFNPNTDLLVVPNSSSNIVSFENVSIEKFSTFAPNNPMIEVSLTNNSADQVLLNFEINYTCGTNELTEIAVNVTDDYGSNLSNFRLVSSTDNSFNTSGNNTTLATGSVSGNEIIFSGFSQSIGSALWFFVIADVAPTVDETDYATFTINTSDVDVTTGTVMGTDAFSNVVNFNNVSTSIPNLKENLLVMDAFPNPFEEQFRIDLPEHIEESEVVITNILGKVIYRLPVTKNATINAKEWPTGIYFVQSPNYQDMHTLRIIKK